MLTRLACTPTPTKTSLSLRLPLILLTAPLTSPNITQHIFTSASSVSDLDSQEDDSLSIPSSLLITCSGSIRSYAKLLLTPMAMSTGFSHHTIIVGSTQQPGRVGSRSSHHLIDQQQARRSEPTSNSRWTHSCSSHRSRITHISSFHCSYSRTKLPIVIISSSSVSLDNKNIDHLSQH
ncbi:hypothetical protein PGT21_008906 [Puccinia graminis f. sp. tritici]|uniref:Uncharacterized protein n=1 Tax=Puccinia graminis f. sp. tritici TaxID=56615 RepID=A0A5B0PM04_PUCGR|nr:hypothetical protein PGTUg99_028523 [Puccinia graminis f. sp. tritici]KAA1117483.1 hypothetical protein PGT21_008906 [Puccinia graminis f. sp. tritici]